jgi:hypothetical protein
MGTAASEVTSSPTAGPPTDGRVEHEREHDLRRVVGKRSAVERREPVRRRSTDHVGQDVREQSARHGVAVSVVVVRRTHGRNDRGDLVSDVLAVGIEAAKKGVGFTALDNGFAAVDNPAKVQAICDRLGPTQIDALLRKWLRRLPHPFTRMDRLADYRYEISVLQAEFSLTQMLDKPVTGRIFFEQVIRDNLDLGRPDQVGLIFGRQIYRGRKNRTPGVFRTRIINSGVTPSLHVDFKHSTIKQYHKERIALRTETTINDPGDFTINKGLTNLPAMRKVGFQANRRLLHVEHISHDPAAGAEAFTAVTEPTTISGQHAAGLRFGDPRAQALLAVLLIFRLHPHGFTNADLRNHLTRMLGMDPHSWPPGRATYDLRRLRLHGLIERIPHTHRYRVTDAGLHHAMFLTRVHNRLIRTGQAQLVDPQPPAPAPLRAAARAYDAALDQLVQQSGLAA